MKPVICRLCGGEVDTNHVERAAIGCLIHYTQKKKDERWLFGPAHQACARKGRINNQFRGQPWGPKKRPQSEPKTR